MMLRFRKTAYWALSMITVMVAIGAVLSVFRNTDHRFLKMLDFPRIQFFLTALIVLPLFILMTKKWRWYDRALIGGLLVTLGIHGHYLINYTPLVHPVVPTATAQQAQENAFHLVIANVKMKNRNAELLLEQLNKQDPDLILLTEIDSWWDQQLNLLSERYPYQREVINEVAYGMGLYSKFPLEDIQVDYLQNAKVPSISGTVALENGNKFRLFCVHPVPPPHFRKHPDNSGQSEVALIKIGKSVEKTAYPAVVAGDFNDVVWSYTDALTQTENLLHDVRVGRGFYNSFNAEKWYMKWPLDHIFVTEHFSLLTLERLPSIGADHFPISAVLVLE